MSALFIAISKVTDPDKIKATFKNGVLEVQIPKGKEVKGKKIDVKVE